MTPAADMVTSGAGEPPLNRRNGLRYGLLGLPLAFCALPLYVSLPNHYALDFAVPLAWLGAVLLGARTLDAVMDPLIGHGCDTQLAISPKALMRWCTLAALVLALAFACLFLPPPWVTATPTASLLWAAFWLVFAYLAYSVISVAHQSWGASLGGDGPQRARVVAWREGFGLVGVVLASVLPGWLGLPAMATAFTLLLVAGFWLWRRQVLWRQQAGSHVKAGSRVGRPGASLMQTLLQPLKRPEFRGLLAVYLVNGAASAIPATLVLFFVQDWIQAPARLQAGFLATYFVCAALSVPLWVALVRPFGLVPCWLAGMLLSVAAFLFASQLGAGDVQGFMGVCVATGLCLGAEVAVPGALLAGIISRAHGRGHAEGRYFGWWNFATKFNLAIAAGLTLPLLQWLGYAPGTRDPHGLQSLLWVYCLVPCALKLLAAGLLHFSFAPLLLAERQS
ncbi:MAG: MFS transporter [Rhodoferax sp.]